jgi:4-hydroxyproline epimerase
MPDGDTMLAMPARRRDNARMEKIVCIDSHTGGEPTRLVVSGFPDLGSVPLPQVVQQLQAQHDHYRSATVCEPRGSDVVVGALLLPPRQAGSLASVVFFNNVGYLGMCGHGTIGLMATLEYLGRVSPGHYAIDTPVGTVAVHLRGNGVVEIGNVPAYRHRHGVQLQVPGIGAVHGDVAWGGNWFFLCDAGGIAITRDHVDVLTDRAWAIRQALEAAGVTGRDGAPIDHVELMGPALHEGNDGRNFVLCPGRAYDRSPCGTGTSAKLACLAADGRLAPGARWRQESVLGSVFEAYYRMDGEQLLPSIVGQAHVCAETSLLIDASDPYAWGVTASA